MAFTTRGAMMFFVAAAIGFSMPLHAEDFKLPVPVPPDAQGAMFNDDIKQEMFATSKPRQGRGEVLSRSRPAEGLDGRGKRGSGHKHGQSCL